MADDGPEEVQAMWLLPKAAPRHKCRVRVLRHILRVPHRAGKQQRT